MFNYENRQMASASDFKVFTSINHVRFAHSWVDNKGCTRLAAASDKVYHLLAHGWWFSSVSFTIKTGRHDIAEILLKVANPFGAKATYLSFGG
jgi:hypothetical protein